MSGFKAVPVWAWVCLGLVLLCGWQQIELADVRAEFAGYQRDVAEAGRLLEKAEREKERQWNAKFMELEKDAKSKADRRTRDSADAASSLQRMLDRAKAAEASSRACGNALTASISAATFAPAGVLTELLERLGEVAGLYAAVADERGAAGQTCSAAYEAVSHVPP